MPSSNGTKKQARQIQDELGIKYTAALRAVENAPKPKSPEEQAAVRDTQTDPAILHAIARRDLIPDGYSDGFNQENGAENPATPVVTLRWLADNPAVKDTWVQDRLLRNPSTPEDILRRYMLRDEYARKQLAGNPAAGDDMVMEVVNADPQDWQVEYAAFRNPGISDDTRDRIERILTVDSWKRWVTAEDAAERRKTFRGWLSLQEHREDPIGDVARDAKVDPNFPTTDLWRDVEAYLEDTVAYDGALRAWTEYSGHMPTT